MSSPAYRATLLYICFVPLAVVRDERNEFVEVFVRLRVNLQFLKGKIAVKRACLRSSGHVCGQLDFLDPSSQSL
jgi:hypothetical protein